ncbi:MULTISPECIES: GAF domain-containing protein [unclassified Streptomyces]|uniref:GAF domain-containing sensor histidine kinase n=1 Tax=unclassified Streptomyces TaxID=2593676 RepID=UPI000B2275A9|nr:GAF domain-containing protein [Streptomyces sp. CNQ-509]
MSEQSVSPYRHRPGELVRRREPSRFTERWLEATADITAGLLSGLEEPAVLEMIVERARRILETDLGVLALAEGGSGRLRVALASGKEAETYQGVLLPCRGSFAGAAAEAGKPLTSADLSRDPRITAGSPGARRPGPAVAVPMVAEEGVRGVLLLARSDPLDVFTDVETGPLLAFAGQAAIAMELADRRRDAEQVALLKDRDRIARDLHDLAIQRLFATGISVQSALRFVEHEEARARLLRAVDELDETTRIIRSTIFGLRTGRGAAGGGLRAQVVRAVEDAVPVLGFTPSLRLEGLIDTDVPADVADAVRAVLGEALTNVGRHARASAAEVVLTVTDGTTTLSVQDDGVGMPRGGRRSGLANLADRAEKLGGRFSVTAPREGGTCVTWSVPLTRR